MQPNISPLISNTVDVSVHRFNMNAAIFNDHRGVAGLEITCSRHQPASLLACALLRLPSGTSPGGPGPPSARPSNWTRAALDHDQLLSAATSICCRPAAAAAFANGVALAALPQAHHCNPAPAPFGCATNASQNEVRGVRRCAARPLLR